VLAANFEIWISLTDLYWIGFRLFKGMCEGVGYMHENGVIHRDLKPNNIFLREDQRTPVVGDLGLCLIMEQDERLTEMTEAVGARQFMAPELEDGRYESAQPVADIYSLGKILYWLVSNKVIFSRKKHRDEKYDLTRSDKTAGMAFVYHLLSGTIATTPSERKYSDATRLAVAVHEIIERIAVMAHAIDPSVPQGCAYCGVGTYQTILDGNSRSPGFEQKIYHLGVKINSQDFHRWLILACDYCGNIQFFRGDVATKNPKAWTKGSGI
jgi:serine/threonine protein kinase